MPGTVSIIFVIYMVYVNMSYSKIKCRVLNDVRANISEEDLMKGVMIQELMLSQRPHQLKSYMC